EALGADAFARWMKDERRVLVTDTTMRDAHQSLFATRMRTRDMLAIAPYYAHLAPQLFSLECWGGATFDVAMRFLGEDPWARLAGLREQVPNLLLQMLLRGSNAVGYTSYPDNVVRHFVAQAADAGIDLFRVFDSLNWVENMRVSIDAVRESGKLCEGTVCYTGDLSAARASKYDLGYYVGIARELERAGAHILGIKDMAGVCKPAAIRQLVTALKQEIGLPIHFHTHDTSGIAAATVLAAVEAGVDAVDAAMDSMSGLTSQPNLGAIVEALRGSERDPGLARDGLRAISHYWEGVRQHYSAFESDIRAGTADVYRHAMPGGQYTNLREQARALGIAHRWPEVAEAYAEVNTLFGDIVKVTPTSKVVGDMALYMVTTGLSAADVMDPQREIAFPESVVSLFRGELGFPPEGFPEAISRRVLKGDPPPRERPGAHLPPQDLDAARAEVAELTGAPASDTELASWLMYPKVFAEFVRRRERFGDVGVLPTHAFFYGLREDEEIAVDIDRGKTLIIRYITRTEPDDEGFSKVFFELNGQPRVVKISVKGLEGLARAHPKADDANPAHIAAPMPGMVVSVAAAAGRKVEKGDPLVSIEAMKMETVIRAERAAVVDEVLVAPGVAVEARDLLVVLR
ncbi:MAG TPA: pyruvate carboxylase subunit B, partial [Rhodocyclaceae bacterium]|nr:pyruvate carboxylase subunit B [Rhodocyclaceae bacterium]